MKYQQMQMIIVNNQHKLTEYARNKSDKIKKATERWLLKICSFLRKTTNKIRCRLLLAQHTETFVELINTAA